MISSLWQDTRYALRTIGRQKGFAAVAIVSLALGIGLNTAVFTVVDAVLLRPLPVTDPDSLAAVYTSYGPDEPHGSTSYPDLLDLAATNTAFEALVGHSLMFAPVSFGAATANRLAIGEVVTANYFDVLGVTPQIGRGFTPEEDLGAGAHPVTVISHDLWRTAFGAGADVVGRTVTLRGRPYTIIGVAPDSFTGVTPGISAELWVPVSMVEDIEPVGMNDFVESPGATRLERRGSRWFFVLGRLRPGVTVAAADANLAGIMAGLEREYPRSNEARTATVVPASTVRFHPIIDAALRPTGAVLLAAVGLVLLIACANLASMLLAQGSARRREIAVRTAIGASRARVVRQLVVENMVLSTIGGMAGVLLGFWAVRMLAAFQPPVNLPLSLDLSPSLRVLVFGVVLSLSTGIISAFIPAIRASRADLIPALKDNARTGGGKQRTITLRSGLVVAQIATSLVLVVSGILLSRSFASAVSTDPGFRAAGLGVATIGLDFHGYSQDQGRQFYDRALERISRLPGVVSAGISERLPFSPNIINTAVMVDGQPNATPPRGLGVDSTRVSDGYFATMELAPIDGRLFDDRDTPDTETVAVINLALAERLFPGERAVGRRLVVPDTGAIVAVVGVIPNHAVRAIGETPRPLIHFSRSQQYTAYATIVARTAGPTDELVLGMTRELRALEPDLILMDAGDFDTMIGLSLFPVRAGGVMLGGLAALALVLAGIGLYGSLAFAISRQTREIGIRMALGAQRRVVVRGVLREGLVLFAIGAVIGVGLAALSAGALSGVLYGVAPLDPISFILAVLVLGVIAVVASLVPAARAASVDPLVVLRQS